MTKGEIKQSFIEKVVGYVLGKLWALMIGNIVITPAVFLLIKNKLLLHPYLMLVLLVITTMTTCICFLLWFRLYWMNRLEIAFGVKWDKKYNPRCMNCEKPLKYSSNDLTKLWCPDQKGCNSKHPLIDDEGNKITKQQAIELYRQKKTKVSQ